MLHMRSFAIYITPWHTWMGRGKPETAKHERPAVQEPFEVLQCQGEHHVIAQVNALEKRLFSKSFALTGAL